MLMAQSWHGSAVGVLTNARFSKIEQRELPQMTSSKIRDFQTPSPSPSSSVTFARPPLDDVIFHRPPAPPFPR